MPSIIALILLYAVVQALLLGIAVGIGFLLHWLIPGVNIGIGILVGLISTIASAYLFVQTMKLSHRVDEFVAYEQNDEEDDDYDDALPELHFVTKERPARRKRSGKRR